MSSHATASPPNTARTRRQGRSSRETRDLRFARTKALFPAPVGEHLHTQNASYGLPAAATLVIAAREKRSEARSSAAACRAIAPRASGSTRRRSRRAQGIEGRSAYAI